MMELEKERAVRAKKKEEKDREMEIERHDQMERKRWREEVYNYVTPMTRVRQPELYKPSYAE